MGYYKFRKRDLLKELEQVPDDDFIMINMGEHTAPNYPITYIEDSTSCGFWELRCDPEISFWDALDEATICYSDEVDRDPSKCEGQLKTK